MASYELFIAKRYLKSKRKTGFISIITYISIGGVTIGVAALIIVLSLMNGFAGEIRERLIGMEAHIRVFRFGGNIEDVQAVVEKVRHVSHVTGVSPFILREALLTTGRRNAGVIVKGIDRATVGEVSDIDEKIVAGGLDFEPDENGLAGVVLGRFLADRLGLGLGDRVYLMSPEGLTPGAFVPPKLHGFSVVGIFETGMDDFDSAFACLSNASAQDVFQLGDAVMGVEVKTDNLYNTKPVGDAIVEELEGYPYFVRNWAEGNRHLFNWMTIEKWASFIVLSLIILVAAFNIVSTLIMVVLEKTKEVGILKSMGASQRSIRRIFVFEGMVVGVVGVVAGCVLGFSLCWIQDTFGVVSLPADIYIISAVPVDMRILDFLWISAAALGISFLASLYPAWKAASLDPVEAIRYE